MKEWLTEFALEPAGEAQVEFLDEPPEHEGEIHERRPLPPVVEGAETVDLHRELIRAWTPDLDN